MSRISKCRMIFVLSLHLVSMIVVHSDEQQDPRIFADAIRTFTEQQLSVSEIQVSFLRIKFMLFMLNLY